MVDSVQVSCISKREHFNPHERIRGIGGMHNGKRWWLTEDDAIAGLGTKWNFYVNVNGQGVWVEIATHNGRRYLKTKADGYAPNNLLALMDCPL